MTEARMPTTLPSPTRGEFRFVAVDATGVAWSWIDEEMVWVQARGETGSDDPEVDGRDAVR